jgi:hypothetical protein
MIIGGNSDGLVQKAIEVLNSDSLVVAFGGNIEVDIQKEADGLEEAFEGAAIVDNNNSPQKPILRRTFCTKRRARLWAVILLVAGQIWSNHTWH